MTLYSSRSIQMTRWVISLLLLCFATISTTTRAESEVSSSSSSLATQVQSLLSDDVQPRVVGGIDANVTNYPFFVFLSISRPDAATGGTRRVACGGTLIHKDVVLSAAHCFDQQPASGGNVAVVVNATKFQNSPNGFYRTANKVVIHPDYRRSTFRNDLALVHLTSPVEEVTPVSLNRNRLIPERDDTVQVVGLGIMEEGRPAFPENLQMVELQTVHSTTCQAQNGGNILVEPDTQLCASASGKDSCQGDSGGPLLIQRASSTGGAAEFEQVGVVSFGVGCARPVSF